MVKATFYSQGRVDAFLLDFGNGIYGFFDSGFRKNGKNCVEYLVKLGVEKLAFYVGTHAHRNHIEGAAPIIARFDPDIVYIPHERVKERIIHYAVGTKERNATKNAKYEILTVGHEPIKINGSTITVLGPLKIRKVSPGLTPENYNSLVLKVIDDETGESMLLTGDTSASVLSEINKKNPGSLKCKILKNPHHNGKLPETVFKMIDPDFVVVCNSSRPSSAYRKIISKCGASLSTACPISKMGSGNVKMIIGKAKEVA